MTKDEIKTANLADELAYQGYYEYDCGNEGLTSLREFLSDCFFDRPDPVILGAILIATDNGNGRFYVKYGDEYQCICKQWFRTKEEAYKYMKDTKKLQSRSESSKYLTFTVRPVWEELLAGLERGQV